MPTLPNNIRITISIDFLKAFAEVPVSQQKKVREFVQLFQSNPTLPSINYETIKGAYDPNLRSARIDKDYRAIIAKPENGNVYILLWVAKHDDAYQWAMQRRLQINPMTGSLQIMEIDKIEANKNTDKTPAMFDQFSDEQLINLGVPQLCIPQIRNIQTEEQLFAQEGKLPLESYYCLFMLACGESYESLHEEYSRTAKKSVDTNDYSGALDNDDSQCRFKVIEDSLELEALLNSPLEQWRVFLHPLQRKIVEMNASGPVRVTGEAGTGKTVVAIHRANWLVKNILSDKTQRILFTTFTKNLALDIRHNLAKICPVDSMKQIDVINLDAWTYDFLRKNNYPARIIDYEEDKQQELWDNALQLAPTELDFTKQFYKDEWEQVIQPQSIKSLQQYYKASRAGRGRRLDRVQRMKVWPVFEEYRAQLDEHGYREKEDIYADVTKLLQEKDLHPYRAIIVDESQDFSEQAFTMLRSLVMENANDLFIVGDAHQRIYGRKITLSKCGIKITGRSKRLKVNYRTTAQTYSFATRILEGLDFDNLDGEIEVKLPCQSLTIGPQPTVKLLNDFEQEKAFIISHIQNLLSSEGVLPETICLTAFSRELCKDYADALNKAGIPSYIIKTDTEMDNGKKGVRIATMHRVKGIEFDYIIVASACKNILPPSYLINSADTPIDEKHLLQRMRSLLYVSITRARKSVLITGYGELTQLLKKNN